MACGCGKFKSSTRTVTVKTEMSFDQKIAPTPNKTTVRSVDLKKRKIHL